MKTLIIIPAYNEGTRITKVLTKLKKQGYEDVVVIDDGSKDNTSKVSKKAGVKVLRHVVNLGAGAATKTGLAYARINNYDYAVLIDADGQHAPEEVSKLLKQAPKYDVVIGSRLIGTETKNMPLIRRFLNKGGSIVTKILFGLYVRDSQSGFKVLNKKAINKIKLTFNGFEFCSEIIGEIKRNKLSFKEIPIKVIYTEESLAKGQTFFNGIKMIIKILSKKLVK